MFFRSDEVKVFPCAYRGAYTGSTEAPIDPYARSFAEYNFCNIWPKVNQHIDSYIVSYDEDTEDKLLKCVIGGYYFEIKTGAYTKNEFKYLAIKVASYDENDNKSTVLVDYSDTNIHYLDAIPENGTYSMFNGLYGSADEVSGASYVLQI